jgi:hypothetical protein
MVLKQPQRILMNLQLLIESVLIAIFVTNSVNVLGGADSAPPPFLGLKDCFLMRSILNKINGNVTGLFMLIKLILILVYLIDCM